MIAIFPPITHTQSSASATMASIIALLTLCFALVMATLSLLRSWRMVVGIDSLSFPSGRFSDSGRDRTKETIITDLSRPGSDQSINSIGKKRSMTSASQLEIHFPLSINQYPDANRRHIKKLTLILIDGIDFDSVENR